MIRPEPSAVDFGEFGSGSLMVHRFRGKRGHGLHPSSLVARGSPAGSGCAQSAAPADPSGPPTQLVVDEEQGRTGYFFSRRPLREDAARCACLQGDGCAIPRRAALGDPCRRRRAAAVPNRQGGQFLGGADSVEWLRYLGHRLRILTRMIRHHTDTQPHPREAFYPVSVIEHPCCAGWCSWGEGTITTILASSLWASHSTRSKPCSSGRLVPSPALALRTACGPPRSWRVRTGFSL